MKLEENPQFIFGIMGMAVVAVIAIAAFVFALYAAAIYAIIVAFHIVRDEGWPLAIGLGVISAIIFLTGIDAVSRQPEEEKFIATGFLMAATSLPFYGYLAFRALMPMNRAKALMLNWADNELAQMRITTKEHREYVREIRQLSNDEAERQLVEAKKNRETRELMARHIQVASDSTEAFDVPPQTN